MAAAGTAHAATQDQLIDAALQTGDSSQLTDSQLIAKRLQREQTQISQKRSALLSSLYLGISRIGYAPTPSSQWIIPGSLDSTFPFIVGDKGNVLAAISVNAGGRAIAYGKNIFPTLTTTNAEHLPLFKRAAHWLVSGSASGAIPKTVKVSVVGTSTSAALNGLQAAGLSPTDAACNALLDEACARGSQLLVLGNGVSASTALTATVNARLSAGLPILYVNTNDWGQREQAAQILNGLALIQGPYGGNFWAADTVAGPGNPAQKIAAATLYGLNADLIKQIADNTWRQDYPWGTCSTSACAGTADFNVFDGHVQAIRNSIDSYNVAGQNIFKTPDTVMSRLWVLWADTARKQIRYPMDKIGTAARFQEAYLADAVIGYVRETGQAQSDLGSYASARQAAMPVSGKTETVTLTLPQSSGFTAIGKFLVPGKRLRIWVDGVDQATLSVFMNTQRTGSTRLWQTNKYDRPRFLRSPSISIKPKTALSLVSPYGGTLQLSYSGATPGQKITIKMKGAASQPFLDIRAGEDNSVAISTFATALNAGKADWMELRSGNVEIHSKADSLLNTVNSQYNGDVQRLIKELNELFVTGAYSLAGFALPNQPLSPAVAQECVSLGWDCTSKTLNKMPDTQHINVDTYAHCGAGCAGNPYDQSWGFSPRGWGESHELGHNLQINRLKVYGGISAEVSNQLFPLQKDWRMFRELGLDMENDRVNYRSAYNQIVAGQADASPIQAVYQRLWANPAYAAQNRERMAFYTQWTHYWADAKADPAQAWDIWTLMYLHQRLVDKADWATHKTSLGYSTYAARPGSSVGNTSTDGNDNLLIGLSWLTKRDQRPTFALWGISTSPAAQAQVSAYGFAAQPAFFYANNTTNNYSTAVRLDMSKGPVAWPFP